MKTAHILVRRCKTDEVSQRVLVRQHDDGYLEFYHLDQSKWCDLPKVWEEKAKEALDQEKSRHGKFVDISGDILEVFWDGNVWVSPHNGQQHSRAEHAMRSELTAYFRASGDDVEDKEILERVERYISQMENSR